MPSIKNKLIDKSFSYGFGGRLENRLDEILDFEAVCEYCQEINENIYYSEEQWYEQDVEEGIKMVDWLYSGDGSDYNDIKALILRLSSNFCDDSIRSFDETINVSLGEMADCAYNWKSYADARRHILAEIDDPKLYCEFMQSCFLNCEFSVDIDKAIRQISRFSLYTSEITYNLSVLNDMALPIFLECGKNSKDAMAKLSTLTKECSGDPKHRKYLKFPFQYTSEDDDSELIKEIVCEPHLKLVRRDSDLRIYFYWYDKDINNGEKVLIGRIGSHPYKQ